MKVCAACHTDLPKDSYSKKQWKLDKYQRRCKECITNNLEVQQSTQQNNDTNITDNNDEIVKLLDSMYLEGVRKISDEELFKQSPSQYGDCPICFIQLPSLNSGRRYYECCGKMICSGCIHAPVYDNQGNKVDEKKCPFCRSPQHTSNEEMVKRTKKRMQAHDPIAIFNLGVYYDRGSHGYPQNHTKALELWHRAAELGYTSAYASIGYAYDNGDGVEVDMKKANYYYELAAIKGVVGARHNLGLNEANAGNMDRALKHFIIAIRGGYTESLKGMKQLYSNGIAITKDDYMKALQSYQEYLGEIKSVQRDKAAAADERYRYY